MNEQPLNADGGLLSSTLDVLLDIELPVTVRFGRTQMTLEQVVSLKAGSIVEFDRRTDEPVEVLVNGRVVARGEAVLVQGNYGVRISQIASRRERLESAPSSDIDRQSSGSPQ
jgi:flagellar motor switch protein FliN/FliY